MTAMTDATDRQAGSNRAALLLSLMALVLAALALFVAFQSLRKGNDALDKTSGLEATMEKVMSIPENQASPGGGVGDNQPVPAETDTGNTMPNANGQ